MLTTPAQRVGFRGPLKERFAAKMIFAIKAAAKAGVLNREGKENEAKRRERGS
jgi:hypothetical protein